ncbi:MAG TPA: alpha-amylase family glycosyl hydrolase [Gemmatimonadaceae bacterium]|nr:alpha-amylase family glycosyl hydrolase [Gemmatimonadaceae bacterium]
MTTALTVLACSPSPPNTTSDTGAAATPAPTSAIAATPSTDPAFHPEWSKNSVIYEVNVRQYTPEGTLAALQTHLPRLKQLGVDILWLMPVQPIGVKNRKGKLGSYYAISDYTAVNPEFGTEADFKSFVNAAHVQGMKVVLDWVANHTAYDHEWVTSHPDFYERKADGSLMNARDNEGRETDWTDVAELLYTNTAMRQAMISEMKWWVDQTGIDGFRCDVAGGAPIDFWIEARTALKAARADLFLLAEAEDPRMHSAFDMTYGWELHHVMNDVVQGKKTTDALDKYFAKDNSVYGLGAYRMYFTSNHDENSWNGSEFERMGENHKPAFILSATAQSSMPLLYTGQEVSTRKRLRFFEKDTVDWKGPSLAPFYSQVFALKHAQPALANGPWGAPQTVLKTDGGDRVYAFTRTKDANTVLVAVNFGDKPVSASYTGLTAPGAYMDWFSKESAALGAAGKLEIAPHGYRVLVK